MSKKNQRPKFTIKDFKELYPTEESCLEFLFRSKFPDNCQKCEKGTMYRAKNRTCYSCGNCGTQVYPLVGSIFEGSTTPLQSWFHAIFLFSQSKNGVAAKELERQLGVTYKTAWRMAKLIRSLMKDGDMNLGDGGKVVEMDETFIGGKSPMKKKMDNKSTVFGAVERDGQIATAHIEGRHTGAILGEVRKSVDKNAHIMTDDFPVYRKLNQSHEIINHSKEEWVKGNIHTNNIEGYWSQLKRSIHGTYHYVSPKYLQTYLDEFSYRYNRRHSDLHLFYHLIVKSVS